MLALLRIVKVTEWEDGNVITIPLVPQTRDEPRMTQHVWLSHHWAHGTKV